MTVADTYRLSSRYTDDAGTVFMTGLQALARLPVEQLRADRLTGLRTAAFVSGYPGSPLGGYDGELARAVQQAPDLPIVVAPAVNEEQAVSAVMGSQLATTRPDSRYDGVLGIFYGKGPGVDRASDALRHAVFAGSDPLGGAMVIAGDDPHAKSSTIPSSSVGTLADMHIPVLYPGTPGEALDLGRHALCLSRATGLWTSLKIVADVADGSGTVHLDPSRVEPKLPTVGGERYTHTPDGRLLTPATVDTEREIYEVRRPLAIEYAALNRLNRATVNPADAWIGIVASGVTYRELREALRRLGLESDSEIAASGIRLMCMQMPMPFSPERARRFARGLEEVFVVEEKHPNIESLVKDALYNEAQRPRVTGKFDESDALLLPGHGGLAADDLLAALRRRLAPRIGHRLAPEQPRRELIPLSTQVARTPYFCSGCPHNRSTRVPEGAAVGAGIGCHTMTLLMESEDFGDIIGLTCMGQEGAQWVGMAPFVDTAHIFQNLGDGTFFHSGQLAIQGAVAAGVDITYKLLWNRTVAMTGGQDPTGVIGVAEVARVLLAQGVARVLVTTEDVTRYRGDELPEEVDVWPRSRMLEAQELLADTAGVTVLIHDQQCAAEARRGRKRGTVAVPRQRVVINERICEGCGDCSSISNCLSVQPVETPFGRKTRIDQTSCNLDFSCMDGDCPAFMTVTMPGRLGSWLHRATSLVRGRGRRRSRDLGLEPVGGHARGRGRRRSRDLGLEPVGGRGRARGLGRGRARGRGGRLGGPQDGSRPLPPFGAAGVAAPEPADLPEPETVVPADDLSLLIVGIGGTGVVTVSQVIGTAAMFDGYEVRGLDQIGLSQKAGPVVSDLRLTRGVEAASNRLGAGQADVLLAFDQLGAASPAGMSRCDPARTVVVGSTSATPTGAVVAHPERSMPDASDLESVIASGTREDCRHWADAQRITSALFGNAVTANVFVVGMAVQAGALPLAAGSIEQAIELNGVAVSSNLASFRWGRAMIARPETVAAAVSSAGGHPVGLPALDDDTAARVRALSGAATPGTAAAGPNTAPATRTRSGGPSGAATPGTAAALGDEGAPSCDLPPRPACALDGLAGDDAGAEGYHGWELETAVRELCAYQSPRLASRYLDFVESAAAADAEHGDGSGRLTQACARGYFKLLAYKDEYEVARLMVDAAANAKARQLASDTGGRLAWRLHPPILRALGLSRKISVPLALAPLFRLLAAMRFMRGSVFDPFGHTRLRRAERSLPGEYRAALEADLRRLDTADYDRVLRRASLPELVRGYEQIKMAGIKQLREGLSRT